MRAIIMMLTKGGLDMAGLLREIDNPSKMNVLEMDDDFYVIDKRRFQSPEEEPKSALFPRFR